MVSEVRPDIWVIVAGEDEQPNLFWPVQVNGKSADPAGAPFSDYHGPIMSEGAELDLREVVRQAGLSNVRMTGVYDPHCRLHQFATEFDGAFIADISNGAENVFEFQQREFPKHAKKMRRLARKVEREVGELTFEFDAQSEADFHQLMTWKRAQYRNTGRHDVLGPDWSRELLYRLWKHDDPTCKGFLHTLKFENRLVAAEFNLSCRSTIHGWIPAYDPEYSSYAPGLLIQQEIMREASARGFNHYDLGVSAGHYKKYYSSYQLPVIRATIRSSAPVSRLGLAGQLVWKGLETSGIPKVSGLAGQVRRRYEVIRSAEISLSGRIKGVIDAAKYAVRPDSTSGSTPAENG
tara:strand:+ start:14977 stop:16023 length:1047 start_codon:yes stop_codon:yes gene_type:complete